MGQPSILYVCYPGRNRRQNPRKGDVSINILVLGGKESECDSQVALSERGAAQTGWRRSGL